jgi:hypothetical protein
LSFNECKTICWSIQGKNQIQRVVRKNGHGVSLSVLQECQKNPEEMDKVRGKITAAPLEGKPSHPSICSISFYNTQEYLFHLQLKSSG